MEKKRNGITRRAFLKGAAAGSISVAAMGLLTACTTESTTTCEPCSTTDTTTEDWLGTAPQINSVQDTQNYDVVVIGAGHAGQQRQEKQRKWVKRLLFWKPKVKRLSLF